jgi:hypothetical protein
VVVLALARATPRPIQYGALGLVLPLSHRLIWQYAPEETTLGTADEMACKILNSILEGKYLV